MKLLAKLGLFGVLVGAGAGALYAAPDLSSPESPTDMQVRAQQIHGAALDDLRHTDHLQAVARKEKDVIKLNCVNDKLVQIKPQVNLIEKSQLTLVGPTGAASFEDITQAGANVRRLREEADQCVGEAGLSNGESSNGFTGPKIPDDPYQNPWGTVIEPPAYASPFT